MSIDIETLEDRTSELVVKLAVDKDSFSEGVGEFKRLTEAIQECNDATQKMIELHKALNELMQVSEQEE